MRRINSFKELLYEGSAWISKAQELVIVPVLVPAAKRKPKTLVGYWDIPTPIFRRHLLSLNAFLGQFMNQIFSEPFPPKPRIYLFLLAVVRWKFR